MGEISDDFAFWQERSHILRTWQEEASSLETPGNSSPTAAGRPALAKLVQLVLQLQTLWEMGFRFLQMYIFRSSLKRSYKDVTELNFPGSIVEQAIVLEEHFLLKT